MGSFEWMELQTLTVEISSSRTRLSTARAHKDHRLARVIEEEIAAAEKRRNGLLAHITTNLASASEGDAREESVQGAESGGTSTASEAEVDEIEGERPPLEPADPTVGIGASLPAFAPTAGSAQGGMVVWDQLTSADIERARSELDARRAEVLARHAEELKALDADHAQLEALEQAIDAFLRRFNPPSSPGAVVQLGDEREARLQGRA